MTEPAQAEPAPATKEPPAPNPPRERFVIIPTRLYWFSLLGAVVAAILAAMFDDPDLPGFADYLRYAIYLMAVGVGVWAVVGLSRRHRVVHRSVMGTRHAGRAVADSVRRTGERHEGAVGRFVDRWAARITRLARFVQRFVLRIYRLVRWILVGLWRLGVWAWYTGEKIFWYLPLLFYDLVYYPTYAAWQVLLWALRVAGGILAWALRVVWRILKIFTKLPFVRTWWVGTARPKIMYHWRAFLKQHQHRAVMRIEKGRRLAELRGENPNRWEMEHRARRGFPLKHPERTRVFIRRRIARITEIQRARREGRPIPKAPKPPKKESPVEAAAPEEAPAEPEAGEKKGKGRLKKFLKRSRDEPEAAAADAGAPSTARET